MRKDTQLNLKKQKEPIFQSSEIVKYSPGKMKTRNNKTIRSFSRSQYKIKVPESTRKDLIKNCFNCGFKLCIPVNAISVICPKCFVQTTRDIRG